MNLEGNTMAEKLANFDRMRGKSPIDPMHVEGSEDFDPDLIRDPRMTDAQVSPLVALGQKKSVEAVEPSYGTPGIPEQIAQANLIVVDTRARIDGQEITMGGKTHKAIMALIYDEVIEQNQQRKAMLGPSGGREPQAASQDSTPVVAPRGRRGRPKGSKNKPK